MARGSALQALARACRVDGLLVWMVARA